MTKNMSKYRLHLGFRIIAIVGIILFLSLFLGQALLRAQVVPTDPDLVYFAGDDAVDTAVSIEGEKFKINGSYVYPGGEWGGRQVEGLLLNSRMVNGIYDDMDGNPPSGMLPWDPTLNSKDFIAQMPNWKSEGLAGFTINMQGGSNRCNGLYSDGQSADLDNNPFGAGGTKAFDDWYADGDTPHARYLARLGSVIRAADDLGMVVILGLFYFGQDESLEDEAAVIAAVDATVDWILANKWTNVIIEINNESDIGYQHAILLPSRVHELMQRVSERSSGAIGAHLPHGRLLVSSSQSGGRVPDDTWISNSDFVLLHGNTDSSGTKSMVDKVRAKASWQANPKPIVFNEANKNMGSFKAAVEKFAGWGYFDSDGYQCVYDSLTSDRWTKHMATNDYWWPILADITGAEYGPLSQGSLIMEAEKMTFSSYGIQKENPDWIKLTAAKGTATSLFPGPTGMYKTRIIAVTEDDGQPTIEFWVNGNLEASFQYPLASDTYGRVTFQGPTLTIANGTEIKIAGVKNGSAYARLDNIVFEPTEDTFPPTRLNGQPAGMLPSGTTQVTLTLATDENAFCRYSETAGSGYEAMPSTFTTTGTTSHSTTVPGLADGNAYTDHVRCQDGAGNINTDDFNITFSVALPAVDTTPPVRSDGSPTGTLPSGTTQVTLSLATDENSTCRYSTVAGIDYNSMSSTFTSTGTTAHSTGVSGLLDGNTYSYYVRCQDQAGNVNLDDYLISFTVASASAAQAVVSFTLINADTNLPIAGFELLNDGAVLNLATLPTRNLNIRANTAPSPVGSVRFALDGNSNYRTENGAPYALRGDSGGDYYAWTPSLGTHALGATPYTNSNAGGTAGTSFAISFTVVE